ncbi:hypothetical protein KC973_00300 [Candidatus Saccharibacteria bacterium]|nr:hypothetical protein [Candidatus Saccharibacteria bacterium]
MKDHLYNWWKRRPVGLRKPLVFTLGILLLCLSPIVGSVPGPGGIALFLLSIAILASEFDWAEQLKNFFLHTVPKEVQNRWRPTPKWQLWFDITSFLLIFGALVFALQTIWVPMISFGAAGICLFLFNRERLTRLKVYLRRSQ